MNFNSLSILSDARFECTSNIGRVGKRKYVILADYCFLSPVNVKHELMHAVGFSHKQSRWDRDDYVTIHHKNIHFGNGRTLKY